jgi:hypothetical protein
MPTRTTRGRETRAGATPAARLAGFVARYSPAVATRGRAALKTMRALYPGATQLVYDNYNALAIAFGPTDRAGDIVCSITLYPKWVSLFFTHGAGLPDPERRLRGSGSRIRHVVLERATTMNEPAVRRLIREVLAQAGPRPAGRGALVIKSVSKKQRPRRPAA